MNTKAQVLFLSHGGGPMPLLDDEAHQEMVDCLQSIAAEITKPSAIIVISAHWEEKMVTVTAAPEPPLIYDYYGFPQESYDIAYPCPGEPVLAEQVQIVMQAAGIAVKLDEHRGFDHGLYVPLKIMFPGADIPCIQLSLVNSLDPSEHLDIGRALQGLDYENLLVIGSGFSFHNMKAFFAPVTSDSRAMNVSFEDWLVDTCCSPEMTEENRGKRLIQWEKAPAARFCHPREEHLLPLHVCYGLAGTACSASFRLQVLNRESSMYLWSPPGDNVFGFNQKHLY